MGFIFGKPFQIAPYLKVRIPLKQNLNALTFKTIRGLGNHLKLLLNKNLVLLTLLLKKSQSSLREPQTNELLNSLNLFLRY